MAFTFNIAGLFMDIADPISKTDKFVWKDLPGDPPQVFGKSLDMKARILPKSKSQVFLTLVSRDGKTHEHGPLRSIGSAKRAAEEAYSKWIKADALIEVSDPNL